MSDIFLYPFKAFEQVDGRLLITRWWILEVGRCTLKLKSIIVVFNKSCRYGGIKWYTREAIVGSLGSKDSFCQKLNSADKIQRQ